MSCIMVIKYDRMTLKNLVKQLIDFCLFYKIEALRNDLQRRFIGLAFIKQQAIHLIRFSSKKVCKFIISMVL